MNEILESQFSPARFSRAEKQEFPTCLPGFDFSGPLREWDVSRKRGFSKTVRFEVFKRDRFCCQYCGQTPPMVILEIDHIVPVASGGGDEESNLLTSCRDCNSGKGARSLDVVPASLSDQMEERRERAEQVAAYNAFLVKLREVELHRVEEIGLYWFNQFKRRKNRYVFGSARVGSIRTFLRYLTPVEILDAIDIAHGRFPVFTDNDEKTFRYFCGICWRRIKSSESD